MSDFLARKTRKCGIEDDLQGCVYHNKCSSIDWFCIAYDYSDGLCLKSASRHNLDARLTITIPIVYTSMAPATN